MTIINLHWLQGDKENPARGEHEREEEEIYRTSNNESKRKRRVGMAGTTTKHSSTFPGNPFFFFPQPNMERVIKARLRGEKSERVASRFRESAEKAWTFFFFFYPDIALAIRRVVRFLGTNGRPVDRSTNYTNEDPRNVQRRGNCHLFWRNYFFFPTWPKTFYFSFFRKHDFTFSPRVFLENFFFLFSFRQFR